MGVLKMGWTVTKNLLTRPATLMYPFKPGKVFPGTRGQIAIKIEDCIFCGICQKKCPSDAITVTKDTRTWAIERLNCVNCNYCVEVCPKKCLRMEPRYYGATLGKQYDAFTAPAPAAPPATPQA